VKARILVSAVLVSGGWLAACSKPAAESSESARKIELAEPAAGPDAAVVSDLEARQPVTAAVVRRVERTRVAEAPVVPASPDPMADMDMPAPRVTSTSASTTAEAPPVADLARAPEAPAVGFGGGIGHGLGSFELPAPAPQSLSGGGNRGPMILIRGGLGGIDDKCDTRGGHRGGIAINRLSPGFGGTMRGGIR